MLVRDRRGLAAARREILAELHGPSGVPRAIWFGVAVAVLAIAAALVIVWTRTPGGDVVQVVPATDVVAEVKPAAAPSSTPAPSSEPSPPKMSLDELPLERRPRRRPSGP